MRARRIAIELDHGMGQKTRIYSIGVTIRGKGRDQPIHMFELRRPDVVTRTNGGPERALHVTGSGAMCNDPSWNTRFTLEPGLVTCQKCIERMKARTVPVTLGKLRVAIVDEAPDCGGKPQALFVLIDCPDRPTISKDFVMAWSATESHVPCSMAYARTMPDANPEHRAGEIKVFLELYRDREVEFVSITTKATWES